MAEKPKPKLRPVGGTGGGLLLRRETYEAIRRLLAAAELEPDPSQFEVRERGGKRYFRKLAESDNTTRAGAGGGGTAGAFYTIAVADDGHTYLQGGTVTAGTGVETAANIKIIDSGTGITHTAGVHMYIILTVDGVTADGVLLPGLNSTSASIAYNATIPDNTLPTAASASAKLCHIDLGVFTATGFQPSGVGNFQVSSCPGSYTVSRV